MAKLDESLIARLRDLITELATESAGFLDRQDDPQLWYNRGYLVGMCQVLQASTVAARFADLTTTPLAPDPPPAAVLPWGKAYHHGLEMGQREAGELFTS